MSYRTNILFKSIFLSIFSLLFHITNAQERGAGRLNSGSQQSTGEIRAVIVGVSAYQNLPAQKQLNYADDDAKEFYDFLSRQPNINPENLVLLTDKDAVLSQVNTAIRQQMRDAKDGDTFIFFFAGHGDVQKSIDSGYLLLHEVNLGNEYSWDDAYSLNDLEKNAVAYTNRKKGKVILITDACHSGKLITDQEYSKAFTTGLVRSWENTVKMVSCAPSQVSFEDAYWGGGNGVFTHYLLEALSGKADILEKDDLISVRELERFVTDKVSEDVKAQKGVYQDPEFDGNKELKLFNVDATLNSIPATELVAENNTSINSIGGRSIAQTENVELSDYTKMLLQDFEKAISQKMLIKQKSSINEKEVEIINEKTLYNSLSPIVSLLFSEVNNHLFSIEDNRILTQWDATTLQEITKSRLPIQGNTYQLDEENKVLLASGNQSIKAISTKNWVDVISTLPMVNNGSNFVREGNNLISNPAKNIIEVWDASLWKKTTTFKAGKKAINAIALATKSKRLFVSDVNNNLLVYSLEGKLLSKLKGQTATISKLLVTPNEKKLIATTENEEVLIWQIDNFSLNQKIQLGEIASDVYAFSPQSNWLAISGKKEFFFIDLASKNPAYSLTLDGNNQSPKSVVFTKTNEIIIAANNSIKKIQFKTPAKYATDIYELLLKQKDVVAIKQDITDQLLAALQYESQQIIKPFALGEEVVPSVGEVNLAIKQLDYASKISDNMYGDISKIKAKKLFLQGYELLLKHDVENYEKAIAYFEEVASLEPNAAYPSNALSIVYNQLNELKTAKNKLAKAIETTPRWYEPKSNLGITLMREGKFEEAKKEFENIITLHPNLSKGYYNMSKWHLAKGDYRKSEENIEKAIAVDTDNPALLVHAAEIAKTRGLFKKAHSLLESAMKKTDTYYKPYLALAKLKTEEYLYYGGNAILLVEAQNLLIKANQLSDYLPDVNQQLGSFYLNLYENYPLKTTTGLPAKTECLVLADKYLERAALLAPFNTDIYAEKAHYFRLKGDIRSATNTLRNHLKKTSDFPQGYVAYGKHLMQTTKDVVSAEKQLALATYINPNYAESYLALAEFYHKNNKVAMRDSVIQKAQTIFPTSPSFYFLQGKYLLENSSTKDEGILAMRNALNKDANFKFASTALYAINASNLSDLIEAGYENSIKMVDNSLLIKKQNTYFFTDITGMTISKVYYDKVNLLGNGKMLLERDGLVGYQDINNGVSVPLEYEEIQYQATDSSLIIKKARKEGWLNAKGETIIPLEYDEIRLMEAGAIRVKKGNLFGILNKKDGSELTPIKYKKITNGVWSTGKIPMMCCYYGKNESDAIDGNGKRLGRCNAR